ncbi:MAG TPA: hypothetical protein VH082_04650 [Rudaea sp.]|jgi:hypothetical protein|nr:hypothetical protein [Rudaea sp.]
MMDTISDGTRRWRIAALGGLMLLMLARVPYSASHMDLSRDMFVVWRLLRGEQWPLEGPVLNGMIHLGPVWYYLLALLQLIGRTWFGTIVLLGLIAALQIPVAYLLGKELHSRRAGMLFAIGLVVPSWTTYEWMLPLHPILSALLVVAFLLCCVRYWRSGKRRYFYGMAIAFTLAMHAHPSNIGCAWVGLFVLIRARHVKVRWWDFVLAAFLVIAPLLPFVYADALRGFQDFHKSTAFAADPKSTGSLAKIPALFVAVAFGGTRYLLEIFGDLGVRGAMIAACVVALGGVAGAIGLIVAIRDRRTRPTASLAIIATLAMFATLAILRAQTPYYMTTSSRIFLVGLVAIGLASLGAHTVSRAARWGAACVAILAALVTTYGHARDQVRGVWPFAWMPMFDVAAPASDAAPLLLLPTYAMDTSGRFLCSVDKPSIHGTYANQLTQNYGVEMRLMCGRDDVHIGGSEEGRSHWLGLSRAMFARLTTKPVHRLGPLGVVPARPVSEQAARLEPDVPRYPAYLPAAKDAKPMHLSVDIHAGEYVAVANLGFAFNVDPIVQVKVDGNAVEPVASDRVSAVYACNCEKSGTARLEIDVSATDLPDVDVTVF